MRCKRTLLVAFSWLFWLGCASAHAQSKLAAHYELSLAAITIGGGDWTVEVGKDRYTARSDGELLGIWRAILGSNIVATTHGSISKGRLVPADYTANFAWDDEIEDVKLQFRDGSVSEMEVKPTIDATDRVPLAPIHLQGAIDPLTAGLIPMPGPRDALAATACQRKLPIFDGAQRYDLALTFKRMDNIATGAGYQGPAVVCAMAYQPVAGYNPGSFRVRYLQKNRDMEIWFAPVAGTRLLAMIRISIPTTLGTALLKATQFESVTASPQ